MSPQKYFIKKFIQLAAFYSKKNYRFLNNWNFGKNHRNEIY